MRIGRKRRVGAGGNALAVPDYNGQPLPPPTANDFVSNLQKRMWAYCHEEGLARFAVAFVADAGSRVDLCPARYIPQLGKWVQDFDNIEEAKPFKDQALWVNQLIELFRGAYTDQSSTVWSMLWHKRSAGEVFLVAEDTQGIGWTYTPYGFMACTPKKSPDGAPGWQVKDRPEETGRWVPDHQVIRRWTPHPDWPKLPYSALWAGLKDLDRHKLLSRVIDRGANAALIQRGLMWFPGEAMEDTVTVGNQTVPRLQLDYYKAAQQTLSAAADDTMAGVVPLLVWWDSDLHEPKRIDFKVPFDAEWMATRQLTVEDFARSTDLPSVTVLNGGAGSGGSGGSAQNHWSDLLVDRRTFDMTVGRDLDALCHEDLTRYFLQPQLKYLADQRAVAGLAGSSPPPNEVRWWRVDFDPTRLIVNQDLSLKSLDSYRLGVINLKACLQRMGFRPDEAATPEDIERLAKIIARSAQSLGVSRTRRRETEVNADGRGSQVNTPITSAAAMLDLALGSADAPSVAEALAAIERGAELVWIDS